MICPFRKSIIIRSDITEEFYMECYEKECPYYKEYISEPNGELKYECARTDNA